MVCLTIGLGLTSATARADHVCANGFDDYDCDGYSNDREWFHGTLPSRPCNLAANTQPGAWLPDVNNDGAISLSDLGAITGVWGATIDLGDTRPWIQLDPVSESWTRIVRRRDLNHTGNVSLGDIGVVTRKWGGACPQVAPHKSVHAGRWRDDVLNESDGNNILSLEVIAEPSIDDQGAQVWAQAFGAATYNWNDPPENGDIIITLDPAPVPDIFKDIVVFLFDDPDPASPRNHGYAQWGPAGQDCYLYHCGGQGYFRVVMQLNEHHFTGPWDNFNQRMLWATHEFGRALALEGDDGPRGLEERNGSCGAPPPLQVTIMDRDCIEPLDSSGISHVTSEWPWDLCGINHVYYGPPPFYGYAGC